MSKHKMSWSEVGAYIGLSVLGAINVSLHPHEFVLIIDGLVLVHAVISIIILKRKSALNKTSK